MHDDYDDNANFTVVNIVMQFLEAHDFDGLHNPLLNCSCSLHDMEDRPCISSHCMPAYNITVSDDDEDGGHLFMPGNGDVN